MRTSVFILVAILLNVACNNVAVVKKDPSESMANQLGELMAALDDSGNVDGSYAALARQARSVAHMEPAPSRLEKLFDLALPRANAATCFTGTWGTCASNQITRTYKECTMYGAIVTGTVRYNFTDDATDEFCILAESNHSFTRIPDVTMVGSRGGTYKISAVGSDGVKVTQVATGFMVTSDGIRRTFTYQGAVVGDFTTSTPDSAYLLVTGSTREGRELNAGSVTVKNNLTGVSCAFVPKSLRWVKSCNCPTKGSWEGTCSDGTKASLQMDSCGAADLVENQSRKSISLEQCTPVEQSSTS